MVEYIQLGAKYAISRSSIAYLDNIFKGRIRRTTHRVCVDSVADRRRMRAFFTCINQGYIGFGSPLNTAEQTGWN